MAWRRVRGHEALTEAFRRAFRRGRLAHAYLFTGPPGVGKHLFAVELAKALLCEAADRRDELEACDICPACIQVEAGTHPDFFRTVRPAERHEFPIDLMRELCDGLALRSARGRGKVALVDDADDLNAESANCFLKTLEEPPPGSVLILIGSSPDLQLPTVVSRCQVVRFAPLDESTVDELLRDQGAGDDALRKRLARLCGGSAGFARELAAPGLWEFRRRLLDALASPAPDFVALASEWVALNEKAGQESAAKREQARVVLRLLTDFFADALSVRQGCPPRRSEPEDRPLLQVLAGKLSTEELLDMLERCLEADLQVDRRAQLVLAIEGLVDALGQRLAA